MRTYKVSYTQDCVGQLFVQATTVGSSGVICGCSTGFS